jgi:hypothetical protein
MVNNSLHVDRHFAVRHGAGDVEESPAASVARLTSPDVTDGDEEPSALVPAIDHDRTATCLTDGRGHGRDPAGSTGATPTG